MTRSTSDRFELFASTAPGLEPITAGEIKSFGVKLREQRAQAVSAGAGGVGGVTFRGDLHRLYETNLWLRTASRITVRLGRFHASTFYELERRAKRLPWADFLPTNGAVRLRVTCRKSRLYHSDAVAERILAAIDRAAPTPIEVAPDRADEDDVGSDAQVFVVRLLHDECEISADSSGELLHRRGYRQEVAKAPLRETLAAAMILASGWTPGASLLDPMCGSGTIPIEAALVGRNIAPGMNRRFGFMQWPNFDRDLWNRLLERAREIAKPPVSGIRGADRDEGAIAAASRNAERAGVAESVEFSVNAFSVSLAKLSEDHVDPGWILTNPPYGVRVGDSHELRNLYAKLGSSLNELPGWQLGILTTDRVMVRQTRLPLQSRLSTRNGGIPVTFFTAKLGAEKPNQDGRSERSFNE